MIVYTYISSLCACFFLHIWLMGTIIWLEYCLNVCVCTEQQTIWLYIVSTESYGIYIKRRAHFVCHSNIVYTCKVCEIQRPTVKEHTQVKVCSYVSRFYFVFEGSITMPHCADHTKQNGREVNAIAFAPIIFMRATIMWRFCVVVVY